MAHLIRGFAHELRRLFLARKPQVMLLLLLSTSWLSMDIYQAMVIRDVPVAVVDLDNSSLSRTLRTFINATREIEVVTPPIASERDAERMLTRGDVAGVVLIPSGLSRDVKHGKTAEVLVAVDMSNIVVGKNVHKALSVCIATVGAGVQHTTVRKLGLRREEALARVVPIKVEENFSFNPSTNYAIYIVPGVLFFFLHVYALLLFASVFLPEDPSPSRRHLVGRMIAIGAVSVTLGMVLAYGFLPHAGIELQSTWVVVFAWLACFIVAEGLLVSCFASVIPNNLLAFQMTVIVGMLALMLSGITWPTDMFPPAMQDIAELIPFTPFARGLRMLAHTPTTLQDLSLLLQQLGGQAALFVSLILGAQCVRFVAPHLRRRTSC